MLYDMKIIPINQGDRFFKSIVDISYSELPQLVEERYLILGIEK